jgi:hypothetical protein
LTLKNSKLLSFVFVAITCTFKNFKLNTVKLKYIRIYLKILLEIFIIFGLHFIFILWLLSIDPYLYRLEDFIAGLIWAAVLPHLAQSHWSYYIVWFINLYLCLIDLIAGLILIPIIPNLVHNHWVLENWLNRTQIINYFLIICLIAKFGQLLVLSYFWARFFILSLLIIWS